MAKELTPKQQAFCHEYAVDMNATQAAIRAGYSAKTAESQGSRLLTNVRATLFISKLMAERYAKADITAEAILNALWTNHCLALDAGQLNSSNRALELLGKANRLLVDRVETKLVYEDMSDAELDAAIQRAQRDIAQIRH